MLAHSVAAPRAARAPPARGPIYKSISDTIYLARGALRLRMHLALATAVKSGSQRLATAMLLVVPALLLLAVKETEGLQT
eukprot:SAG31_NODE_112_length_24420_cov_19.787550_1_plen_80_part_00